MTDVRVKGKRIRGERYHIIHSVRYIVGFLKNRINRYSVGQQGPSNERIE